MYTAGKQWCAICKSSPHRLIFRSVPITRRTCLNPFFRLLKVGVSSPSEMGTICFVAVLGLALVTGCGKGIKSSESSSLAMGQALDPIFDTQYQNNLTGLNNAPYVHSPTTAPSFSVPLAELRGKNSLEFIQSQYASYDVLSASGSTAIVSGGLWKLMIGVSSRATPAPYLISLSGGSAVALGSDPNQCAPASGTILTKNPIPICLQITPGDQPSVSNVQIQILLPNGTQIQKVFTLLVMRQIPNFNAIAPQCKISLSSTSITVDQKVTAKLEVSGSAVSAVLNGNPVQLPLSDITITPIRSPEGLGQKTITATVNSGSALQAGATCSATFQVNPIVRTENCSSGSYRYNECSYANVNRVLKITDVQRISAAACVLGSSYGITATGKIWVDDGCRANFTFEAI